MNPNDNNKIPNGGHQSMLNKRNRNFYNEWQYECLVVNGFLHEHANIYWLCKLGFYSFDSFIYQGYRKIEPISICLQISTRKEEQLWPHRISLNSCLLRLNVLLCAGPIWFYVIIFFMDSFSLSNKRKSFLRLQNRFVEIRLIFERQVKTPRHDSHFMKLRDR